MSDLHGDGDTNDSEHYLQRIIESAPVAIIAVGQDGTIRLCNKEADRIFGFQHDEVISKPLDILIPERFRQPHGRFLGDYFHKPESRPMGAGRNLFALRKDGSEFPVEIGLSAIAVGEEAWALATVVDISARKRSEEQLRETTEFVQRVLDNLFAFVGVMTPDGTLIEANRASIESAGLKPSDVIGKKFWDAAWWNYSVEVQKQLREACERAIRGEVVRYDVQVRMSGDSRMWIDFQISALRDTEGRITHLIPSAIDLSDRKKAEEELERSREDLCRAQSVGQIGSWRLDIRSNSLVWTDETHRIFGIPKGTALTYETFLDAVHPDDRELVENRWNAAVHGETYDIEHRIVVGGEIKWVREKAFLEFGDDGELQSGFGIVQDITARKEAEIQLAASLEELRKTQKQLVRKERLAVLGKLAGSVAHEFRSPLTVTRNGLYFLEEVLPATDVTLREVLDEMWRAVRSCDQIISEMLDYVREPESTAGEFPIGEAISSALRQLTVPNGIDLHPIVGGELEVSANQDQVTRILVNLIQNAVHAMPGEGQLALSATRQGDGKVCVEVRDTGCGIAPEDQEKIFEPLFSTKVRGIGLGLAIAKRYASLNGGQLNVESEVGRGTTFRFPLNAGSRTA